MPKTIDLTQGKWRLHTRLGVVDSQSEMGTPAPVGTGNSDVVITFVPPPPNTEIADIAAQLAPVAPSVVKPPSGLEATWYKADFPDPPPPGELWDTQESRGEHWARVFPAAQSKSQNTQPFVQIVQMNWALEDSLRIFVGRLVLYEPEILFFGHGTGNDAPGVGHSFTLTQIE
jgi:hypothetical protein